MYHFLFVQVRSCRKCPTFQTRRTFELIGFGTLAGRRETLSLSCKIVRFNPIMFWLQFPSCDHHARYSNWKKLAIGKDLFICVRRTVLSEDFKLTNLTKRPNEPPVTVNKDLFPWAYTKFRDQVLIIALVTTMLMMTMMMMMMSWWQ